MGVISEYRRRRIMAKPLPEEWKRVIDDIPVLAHLASTDRDELEDITKVLLHEKHFEGAGGLTLDQEMKVTIAAQAALLLLHRHTDYFPRLVSIIVYPSQYIAPNVYRDPTGVVTEGPQVRAGESWTRGAVVLAWDEVAAAVAGHRPGHNVVIHEFTHQLDAENGEMDGVPLLSSDRYPEWARVMADEYARLRAEVDAGGATDIDPYGATNPAEFFAVVTELFFTEPRTLLEAHPDLYAILATYFHQDPARFMRLPRWVITL